jgi:glutathione S-transferase
MIKLGGFSASNYYNKVKLALLEKAVPFEEALQWPGGDPAVRTNSPLGKIPFLLTEQGALCESQVICDWLEASFPTPALMPADPFEAAKVRELIVFLELHLELVARRLYPQAFFGRTVSEEVQTATRKELERNIKAFSQLAKFSPFVAGSTFTLADCAAIVHLPLITMVGKAIWGEDPLEGIPVREYLKMVGERPTVARVQEDRKAGQEAFTAYLSRR